MNVGACRAPALDGATNIAPGTLPPGPFLAEDLEREAERAVPGPEWATEMKMSSCAARKPHHYCNLP